MIDHTRHSRHTSEGSLRLRSFGQQLCTCCPLTCACVQYQRGTGARRCRSISSSLASILPTRRTDTVSITDALTHVKRPEHAISRMRACNPCHVHHRTHQRYLPLHQPRTVSPSASQPFHGQQNTVGPVHKRIFTDLETETSPQSSFPARSLPGGVYDV